MKKSGPHAPPRLNLSTWGAGRSRASPARPRFGDATVGIHTSVRECGGPASGPDPGVESFEKEAFGLEGAVGWDEVVETMVRSKMLSV